MHRFFKKKTMSRAKRNKRRSRRQKRRSIRKEKRQIFWAKNKDKILSGAMLAGSVALTAATGGATAGTIAGTGANFLSKLKENGTFDKVVTAVKKSGNKISKNEIVKTLIKNGINSKDVQKQFITAIKQDVKAQTGKNVAVVAEVTETETKYIETVKKYWYLFPLSGLTLLVIKKFK